MRMIAAALTLVTALAVPALTQEAAETRPAQEAPENTYGQATPEQANAAINAVQAEAARKQLEQNAANRRAYDEALIAREALIREQQEAYEAESAQRAKDYEEAMEKWRADVTACEAGELERCAQVETAAED